MKTCPLPTAAEVRPSTPLVDLLAAAFSDRAECPVCHELKPRHEVEHADGACLSCTTGAGRPPEEPAQAMLRARRAHRPLVAVDAVSPRRRPDARAEGGAP